MRNDLLHDVIAAEARGGTRVYLRIDDGVEGVIDLRPVIGQFRGVFAPLADPSYFYRVSVHPELGTIVWPNGADVDPLLLYCAVRGTPLPTEEAGGKPRRKARRPTRARGESSRRTGGRGKQARA